MFKLILILLSIFIQNNVKADVVNFDCTFPVFASKEGLNENQKFSMQFIIDGENSYVTGNNGSSKVHLVSGNECITFLEVTASGNVMTTTITKSGESVHSRHTVIGELIPTQYYGKCVRR
jgi:hypothetical protein